MSWGAQRRNIILTVIFLLIFIPAGLISFYLFYTPPTCFDGKQNQGETGIDCGGPCVLLCTDQMTEPVALWKRVFTVSDDGIYNVMAYIENPNPTGFIKDARYIFRIFNEDRVLIAERQGVTSILPKSILPLVENNIQTFAQVPTQVTFEFVGDLVYTRMDPRESLIIVKDELLENEDFSPRVRAKIQNLSLLPIFDIDVVVIVYNVFDTVIGVSSTYVDRLLPEETRDIVFTWPIPFSDAYSRIEIIPVYDNQ